MTVRIFTYTNIWAVERKIYAFGDINLPTPVSFKSIGIFFITGVFWWLLLWGLHVPISGAWTFMLWFGPPGIAAAVWSKQLLEGKTMPEYLFSQLSYLLEPAHLYDGKSDSTVDKTFTVEAKVWQPYDDEFLD
jgi:hypothetical protein